MKLASMRRPEDPIDGSLSPLVVTVASSVFDAKITLPWRECVRIAGVAIAAVRQADREARPPAETGRKSG